MASLRSARQAHACIDSEGRRTEKQGRAEMPAEPLWAFLRFSPSRLFSGLLRTLSEHLICRLCAICLTVFLFLRICLFVWHCPIILPKVNGVKSLFRCSNYTNIKARIFLFSVDFRIAIKIYLYLNSAYVPFLACRKANIFFGGKENGNKKKLLRCIG